MKIFSKLPLTELDIKVKIHIHIQEQIYKMSNIPLFFLFFVILKVSKQDK